MKCRECELEVTPDMRHGSYECSLVLKTQRDEARRERAQHFDNGIEAAVKYVEEQTEERGGRYLEMLTSKLVSDLRALKKRADLAQSADAPEANLEAWRARAERAEREKAVLQERLRKAEEEHLALIRRVEAAAKL